MLCSQQMQGAKSMTSRHAFSGTQLRSQTAPASRTAVTVDTQIRAATIVTQRMKKGRTLERQQPIPPPPVKKAAGTQKLGTQKMGTTSTGTRKLTTIDVDNKGAAFRNKQFGARAPPKLLARVQELRLLSQLEKAGLLSQLEKSGLTLSAIENAGLLSKAEELGLLSAATDRNTPSLLFGLTALLFAAGPAIVYLTPDTSSGLVAAQVVAALACVVGGSAAYGGATLLSSLQK